MKVKPCRVYDWQKERKRYENSHRGRHVKQYHPARASSGKQTWGHNTFNNIKHAAKGIQQSPPSPLHPLIYQVFPLKAPLCLCPQLKSGFPLKKNWPSKEMFPLKEVPSPRLFSTYIRYFALWNKVLKNYCPYNMFPPTIMFPHWIFFHQEWICGSLKKNASPRTCCAKRNCPLSLVP